MDYLDSRRLDDTSHYVDCSIVSVKKSCSSYNSYFIFRNIRFCLFHFKIYVNFRCAIYEIPKNLEGFIWYFNLTLRPCQGLKP
ncbi:hypothetical protein D9M72_408150 [compost metagenome]